MTNHAVALKITPYLRIECKFWLADDGWNGICDDIPVTVQAASFEQAKSQMEVALGKRIEALLQQLMKGKSEHAA